MRILALLATTALATAADVTVESPWSRATAPGAAAGAVFAVLVNTGNAPDRLVAAECALADTVELHTHARGADGVMRMRAVEAIALPAGDRVALRPGAEHIMLLGLRRPLAAGENVPLTLRFERAGTLTVLARVGEASAMQAPATAAPTCCAHH